MEKPIAGVFNILATPFLPDGALDLTSLRRLVARQIEWGAQGLTILGVMGEAGKLTIAERQQVQEVVMAEVAGRVPVIVGTSHPQRTSMLTLSRSAISAGAQGVMIAPPPAHSFNPAGTPTDDQLIDLYDEVSATIGSAAIVVQDFPPVNNVTLSPALLAQIAERVPTARYLKLEDPPLLQKISAVRAHTDRLTIFGGLGGMFLLEELQRGAGGTMTGFAFTEILVAVYHAFQRGAVAQASALFDHYLPLIRYENQPHINLSIRKALLHWRGAIDHPTLRAPFTPLDDHTPAELSAVLQRVGIHDPTHRLPLDG